LHQLKQFSAESGLETIRPKILEIFLMAIYLQSKYIENCQVQDFRK